MDVSKGDRYDRSLLEDPITKTGDEDKKKCGLYHKFANYFVDDKENLKDIM